MKKVKRRKKSKRLNNGKFEVTMLNIDDLKPALYNPRLIDDDSRKALKTSLNKWGLLENLVWNKRTGNLVGGHQRLDILKAAGVTEVPVRVVDVDEDEEKEMNVALNSEFIGGQWDALKLKKIQDEIQLSNPESYDSLLIFKLTGKIEEEVKAGAGYDALKDDKLHPDMEIQPYEHWDYIFVVFKDYRDFQVAIQKLKLKQVNHSLTARKKIGLGRCIDGRKLIKLLK